VDTLSNSLTDLLLPATKQNKKIINRQQGKETHNKDKTGQMATNVGQMVAKPRISYHAILIRRQISKGMARTHCRIYTYFMYRANCLAIESGPLLPSKHKLRKSKTNTSESCRMPPAINRVQNRNSGSGSRAMVQVASGAPLRRPETRNEIHLHAEFGQDARSRSQQ
jgi:hypothetical protein